MKRVAVSRWGVAVLSGVAVLAYAGPVGAAPDVGMSLPSGGTLHTNQFVKVGTDRLIMQGNGNLVQTDPNGTVQWSSGTVDNPNAYAVMQPDGNFVVYSASGAPLWSSGTSGNDGDCLYGRATDSLSGFDWNMHYLFLNWPQFSITPCYIGSGPLRTAIVGDSITYQNQGDLVYIGYGALSMQLSGESGLTLEQQVPGTDSLMANPAGSPSAVVLELGANDAISDNTNWQQGWNDQLSAIGNSCTVFVSVNQDSQTQGSTGIATAIDNDMAFLAYVDSGQYHYLDPGWGTQVTLQSDGVHPDSNGDVALANEEVAAVQQDC